MQSTFGLGRLTFDSSDTLNTVSSELFVVTDYASSSIHILVRSGAHNKVASGRKGGA